MAIGLFEAAMLICFAISWPFNLRRAYKARTNIGTSISFMAIILAGYMFGVLEHLINGDVTYVLLFYLLDISLVTTGVLIYVRNGKIDRAASSKTDL